MKVSYFFLKINWANSWNKVIFTNVITMGFHIQFSQLESQIYGEDIGCLMYEGLVLTDGWIKTD
jgi:hypothetical protein